MTSLKAVPPQSSMCVAFPPHPLPSLSLSFYFFFFVDKTADTFPSLSEGGGLREKLFQVVATKKKKRVVIGIVGNNGEHEAQLLDSRTCDR